MVNLRSILCKVNAYSNKLFFICAAWTPQFLSVPISTMEYMTTFFEIAVWLDTISKQANKQYRKFPCWPPSELHPWSCRPRPWGDTRWHTPSRPYHTQALVWSHSRVCRDKHIRLWIQPLCISHKSCTSLLYTVLLWMVNVLASMVIIDLACINNNNYNNNHNNNNNDNNNIDNDNNNRSNNYSNRGSFNKFTAYNRKTLLTLTLKLVIWEFLYFNIIIIIVIVIIVII